MSPPEPPRALRIGMMGTRGVPARYGGFETAIEEIGRRLADAGHEVTVYCRRPTGGDEVPPNYLGMRLVTLPALRSKALETLSHTAVSAAWALSKPATDVVMLFNSANAPFLPLIRRRNTRVAVHVDGLEWRRSKWSGAGQTFYRWAEALSVRWADALIADAAGIEDYYRDEFGATTWRIAYGAPILEDLGEDRLAELGLTPQGFHLVVARFEPENHVELIVRGYLESAATRPLVVVGAAPYSDEYTSTIEQLASADPRVRLVGAVWDQDLLNQLYGQALTYLHGHSVGGTNPSLLRAMGAGAAACVFDVRFNREVVGPDGRRFANASDVARTVESAEADPAGCTRYGSALRDRVAELYRWDDVARAYEQMAYELASGRTRRGEVTGRRRNAPEWRPETEALS